MKKEGRLCTLECVSEARSFILGIATVWLCLFHTYYINFSSIFDVVGGKIVLCYIEVE